jgi:homoserine dehydrogenase
MKTYRFLLAGLGNIGRNLLEILHTKQKILRDEYSVNLIPTVLADSSGVLSESHQNEIDLMAVINAKKAKRGVATLPHGNANISVLEALSHNPIDVVLDATPVNLETGGVGLELTRLALEKGVHVVTANKGPLALCYQELAAMSDFDDASKPGLRFSGAVGGAMPTINVGRSDLAAAHINRVEAVLNGTTQVILEMMASGSSYDEAIQEAIHLGIAETDPTLDVEGWDAANKLVIVTNAVLRQKATLNDVSVTGINTLRADEVRAVRMLGERMSLLATAEWMGDHYKLSVAPVPLADSHPFARLAGDEMAIRYETDIYGTQTLITTEHGPIPSAAAMLRDFLDIHRNSHH